MQIKQLSRTARFSFTAEAKGNEYNACGNQRHLKIHRSAQPETNFVMAVAKEAIFGSNAAMSKRRGRVQAEHPPMSIVLSKEGRQTQT